MPVSSLKKLSSIPVMKHRLADYKNQSFLDVLQDMRMESDTNLRIIISEIFHPIEYKITKDLICNIFICYNPYQEFIYDFKRN